MTALLTSASHANAMIGLCPTPVGPIGLIPCDTACIGSAMISGSSSQSSTYAGIAASFGASSSTTLACAAETNAGSLSFRVKVAAIQAKLFAQLGIENTAEVSAADAITLTLSSSIALYTKWLGQKSLDLINFMTNTKAMLLKFEGDEISRKEMPNSEIAKSIQHSFYDAVNTSQDRMNKLGQETLEATLTVKKFNELYADPRGSLDKINSEYGKYKKRLVDVIYDVQSESFAPPFFAPDKTQLYSEPDLLMSALLLKDSLSCYQQQEGTPYGSYSCSMIAGKIDVDAVTEKANEASIKVKKQTKESFNDTVDQTSKPEQKLASSSCLDGLMGIGIEANIIDIRSLFKMKILGAFKQKITSLACSAVVSKMNAKIANINSMINKSTSSISGLTGGLISVKSSTNKNGVFGMSHDVTDIRNTKLGADISQEFNEKINTSIYRDNKIFGAAGNISFTDASRSSNSKNESSGDTLSNKGKEIIESGQCWLLGDDC
ncbi:hypothetical protein V6259_18110 [Marinomonas sp. TI.3.20]|uniref:hypothetical protein n=1 Tax=Marinomonas sp. TI.3.20 TaxID=3121296 RepID=UPI00311D8A24